MDNLTRRGFLTGILALGAAPAIVKASSLMPGRGELFVYDRGFMVPRANYGLWHSNTGVVVTETLSGDGYMGGPATLTWKGADFRCESISITIWPVDKPIPMDWWRG